MGHRETTALLVPLAAPSSDDKSTKKGKDRIVKKEPKRQNEIKLIMDKVSAFTVLHYPYPLLVQIFYEHI
jgi:hypothetical protein